MTKRALIFGVNGFVGTYMTQELIENGYEVFGGDRALSSSVQGLCGFFRSDITDAHRVASVIKETMPDAIINLAAISSVGASWAQPQATISVNVIGAVNVLQGVLDAGSASKVLLIGSSEEYAPSPEPMAEEARLDASNPYGISKMAQEGFAHLYAERFGLPVYLVRSFNHTGVGQADTFVLPSWCKQVAQIACSGHDGVLRVGNLNIIRDFSDVRDVVRAYRLLIESDRSGEVFNVGSGTACPLEELLQRIASFSDEAIDIEVDLALLRPSDNPVIVCDNTKIVRELGWYPRYSIEETLQEMYDAYLTKSEVVS